MIKARHWWLITVKGLIFIFLGIYLVRYPVSGMLGLIIYGGISLFVSGLIIATFAISSRKVHSGWGWQMGEGILDILLGAILLSNIGLTAATLPFVFAFYGILTGFFWVFQSIYFKMNAYRFWSVAMIAGLFSFLIGILILYRSVIAALTIAAIIGIMFIVHGLFLTLFSVEVSRAKRMSL